MLKIACFAALAMPLTGSIALAKATPAPKVYGPVTVVACHQASNNGYASSNIIQIAYFNNSKERELTSVTFRILHHGGHTTVVDRGHFGSHALINHTFRNIHTTQASGPTVCTPVQWTFGGHPQAGHPQASSAIPPAGMGT